MRNEERSLNGDLHEGSTDGKYRKHAPDRGGHVEYSDTLNRQSLHPDYGYGYMGTEAPMKVTPDGKVVP